MLESSQVGTPALTTTATPWAEYLATQRAYICDPNAVSVRIALDRFFADPKPTAAERAVLADWTRGRFAWSRLAPRYVEFYASLVR